MKIIFKSKNIVLIIPKCFFKKTKHQKLNKMGKGDHSNSASEFLEKCCRIENIWLNEQPIETKQKYQTEKKMIEDCTQNTKNMIQMMSNFILSCNYNVDVENYKYFNQGKIVNQEKQWSLLFFDKVNEIQSKYYHCIEYMIYTKNSCERKELDLVDEWDECCEIYLDCHILYYFYFYLLDNGNVKIQNCFDFLSDVMKDNYRLLKRFQTHMFLIHSFYDEYGLWLFDHGIDRCLVQFKYFTDQWFPYLIQQKKYHRLFFQLIFIVHFEWNIKPNNKSLSFNILKYMNENEHSIVEQHEMKNVFHKNSEKNLKKKKKNSKLRSVGDKRDMFGKSDMDNIYNVWKLMNELSDEIEKDDPLQPNKKKRKLKKDIWFSESESELFSSCNENKTSESDLMEIDDPPEKNQDYFISQFDFYFQKPNLISIFKLCMEQITSYKSSNASSNKVVYICNYLYHLMEYSCFIDLQKPTKINPKKKCFEKEEKMILEMVNSKCEININISDESISNQHKSINNNIKEDQYMIQQTSDNLKWILKNWTEKK